MERPQARSATRTNDVEAHKARWARANLAPSATRTCLGLHGPDEPDLVAAPHQAARTVLNQAQPVLSRIASVNGRAAKMMRVAALGPPVATKL